MRNIFLATLVNLTISGNTSAQSLQPKWHQFWQEVEIFNPRHESCEDAESSFLRKKRFECQDQGFDRFEFIEGINECYFNKGWAFMFGDYYCVDSSYEIPSNVKTSISRLVEGSYRSNPAHGPEQLQKSIRIAKLNRDSLGRKFCNDENYRFTYKIEDFGCTQTWEPGNNLIRYHCRSIVECRDN